MTRILFGNRGHALADDFRLDISTLSRQTSVLESKGYVVRLPDPQDGRSSNFQITQLGAEKLSEAKKVRLERYELLLAVSCNNSTED